MALSGVQAGRQGAKVSAHNRTRGSLIAADVKVANEYLSRLVGLLGQSRSWSNGDRALWIIPSRGIHTIGMRFPIDVLFLDRGRTVVHLYKNLEPWRVSKVIMGARSVLELPAGTIAKTKTQIGDHVEFLTM